MTWPLIITRIDLDSRQNRWEFQAKYVQQFGFRTSYANVGLVLLFALLLLLFVVAVGVFVVVVILIFFIW